MHIIYIFFISAPNPVKDVTPDLGMRNITLKMPRPEGRIDNYSVIWWKENEPDKKVCINT